MSGENLKDKIKKEIKEEPEATGTHKSQNSGNADRPFFQSNDDVERLENELLPYCLQLIEPDASIDMLWEQPDEFMRKLDKLVEICEHFRPKYPHIYDNFKDPLFQVRLSEKMHGVRNFVATETSYEREGKETGVDTEPWKEGKEAEVKTEPWMESEIKIKTEKDIKTEPTEY